MCYIKSVFQDQTAASGAGESNWLFFAQVDFYTKNKKSNYPDFTLNPLSHLVLALSLFSPSSPLRLYTDTCTQHFTRLHNLILNLANRVLVMQLKERGESEYDNSISLQQQQTGSDNLSTLSSASYSLDSLLLSSSLPHFVLPTSTQTQYFDSNGRQEDDDGSILFFQHYSH